MEIKNKNDNMRWLSEYAGTAKLNNDEKIHLLVSNKGEPTIRFFDCDVMIDWDDIIQLCIYARARHLGEDNHQFEIKNVEYVKIEDNDENTYYPLRE